MKRKNLARNALITSILSMLLCVSMLVGTTFAWFTDEVTSSGNKIQSGSLKVDLEMLQNGTWTSIKDSKTPIFNHENWEPGYVDAKVVKIDNEGTLALKWYAQFQSSVALSKLAEVIDVYVRVSPTDSSLPTDRNLAGYTRVGTVAEFVNNSNTTANGTLYPAGEGVASVYLSIVLKMQESAGNDYQNRSLSGNEGFDIKILATQATYENDFFDENYDEDATFTQPTGGLE